MGRKFSIPAMAQTTTSCAPSTGGQRSAPTSSSTSLSATAFRHNHWAWILHHDQYDSAAGSLVDLLGRLRSIQILRSDCHLVHHGCSFHLVQSPADASHLQLHGRVDLHCTNQTWAEVDSLAGVGDCSLAQVRCLVHVSCATGMTW